MGKPTSVLAGIFILYVVALFSIIGAYPNDTTEEASDGTETCSHIAHMGNLCTVGPSGAKGVCGISADKFTCITSSTRELSQDQREKCFFCRRHLRTDCPYPVECNEANVNRFCQVKSSGELGICLKASGGYECNPLQATVQPSADCIDCKKYLESTCKRNQPSRA